MARANSKKAIRSKSTKERVEKEEEEKLFRIDSEGDASVRHALLHEYSSNGNMASGRLRKGASFKKVLKSQEILAQRSSVPGVTSRVKTSEKRQKALVDKTTRDRLKRLAKRDGQGQGLGSVRSDGSQDDVVLASAKAGEKKYNVWEAKEAGKHELDDLLHAHNPEPKGPPVTLRRHELLDEEIDIQAITTPHPGTSYNPAFEEHQALLADVLDKYTVLEEREAKLEELKVKMDQGSAKQAGRDMWTIHHDEDVGSGEDTDAEQDPEEAAAALAIRKKLSKPKTKKQRRKEEEQRAEQLAKAQRKELNRLHNAAQASKKLQKKLKAKAELSLAEKAAARIAQRQRLAQHGLTRYRSGPSKVPSQAETFQLGEELSENLRTLQPEGNLWKDWVVSGMKRGRVPVERANTSKKGGGRGGRGREKGSKRREVELYSFKNFKV